MWSSGRESVTRRIRRVASSVVLAIALLAGERSAEARITRVVFRTVQSLTFGGTSFDAVGPYEKLAGRAATYTGWALRASAFASNDLCDAAGQQSPFLRTKAERQAAGDPRPSLAERYGTHARYVKQFARAAKRLRRQRLLLPEDAVALTMAAEAAAVP